jgi:6-pyruvoyltetrahydropterin/6-carboxytetrahydropterin synthase
MPLIVGREIRFSASHCLPNVPHGHKCARLHGHSYRVAVELRGPIVEPLGWVYDFGALDGAMKQLVHSVLDHRHLNEIAGLENPTSEVLAGWVLARMRLAVITKDVEIHSVSVFEGDSGGWCRLEL